MFQAATGHSPVVDADGFNRGFYPTKNYVEINGFEIKNADMYGIQVAGTAASPRLVSNEAHHSYKTGIVISSTVTDPYLYGNESYENGQEVNPTGGSGHGILCYADEPVIEWNSCHDNGDAETTLYASGLELNGVSNAVVQYNSFYNNYFYGIDVCQSSTGALIEYNTVHGNDRHGISLNTGATGNDIRLNVVYKNGRTNAFGAGIWCAASSNNIIRNTVANNNGNSDDSANISFPGALGAYTNNVLKGNITFDHLLHRDFYAKDTGRLASSDYNCFHDIDNEVDGEIYCGAQYTTLAAYKSGTGFDTNSISSDPLFMDEGNDDYALKPASPCRDVCPYDIGGDFRGPLPDMGGLEFQDRTIFEIRFESNDFSECTGKTEVGAGSSVTTSVGAAMLSSSYGCECEVDGVADAQADIYKDFRVGTDDLRFRIWFDFNSLVMADGDIWWLCWLRADGSLGGVTSLWGLRVQRSGANYQLQQMAREDDNTASYGAWFNFNDLAQAIEVHIERAGSATAGDGRARVWIAESGESELTLKDTEADVDNYDLFRTADRFYYGFHSGVDVGTDGIIFIDEIWCTDAESEIGPGVGMAVPVMSDDGEIHSLVFGGQVAR